MNNELNKKNKNKYKNSPDHQNTGWPPGIIYIVGNEACERFGYYGMRAILYVHLVVLFTLIGETQEKAADLSTSVVHMFNTGVYALPMICAILADRLIGKFNTIIYLSLVYCIGYIVLAIWCDNLIGMYVGLTLIAIGSGGIKPCISANVGDQFGKNNWFRLRTVFQIFYFSINFGSFFATILIPRIREAYGPHVAFSIPGILMFIATLLFWLGRYKFVHISPQPGGKIGLLDTLSSIALFMTIGHFFFTGNAGWKVMLLASLGFLSVGLIIFAIRQQIQQDDGFLAITLYATGRFLGIIKNPIQNINTKINDTQNNLDPLGLSKSRFWAPAVQKFGVKATEGPVAVFKVISIFIFVSIFWALFDQHSSSWIRQATMMDLTLWGSKKILPSEIPALNPLMVMILIPLMNIIYNISDKIGFKMTPLRRMTGGMLLASIAFGSVTIIQFYIDTLGIGTVWFGWQIISYLLITISEVMVSITGLEFAYSQAPARMKSTIMGFWLLSVALGNIFVALLAKFGGLSLINFFLVFTILMALAGIIFGIISYFYVPRDYAQE